MKQSARNRMRFRPLLPGCRLLRLGTGLYKALMIPAVKTEPFAQYK